METISFVNLTPEGVKQKVTSATKPPIRFVRATVDSNGQALANSYERVYFSPIGMDRYNLTKGHNGIQFYGIINGQLIIATCPEGEAKKMNGARGEKKVNYFNHAPTNKHLVELGLIPENGDCEVELTLTEVDWIQDAPESYIFYTVSSKVQQTETAQAEEKVITDRVGDEHPEDDQEYFGSKPGEPDLLSSDGNFTEDEMKEVLETLKDEEQSENNDF